MYGGLLLLIWSYLCSVPCRIEALLIVGDKPYPLWIIQVGYPSTMLCLHVYASSSYYGITMYVCMYVQCMYSTYIQLVHMCMYIMCVCSTYV